MYLPWSESEADGTTPPKPNVGYTQSLLTAQEELQATTQLQLSGNNPSKP